MIASKEIRIKILTIDLMEGKKRGELLTKYGKEWRISDRSFDRILEKANKLAETSLQAIRTTEINKTQNNIESKKDYIIGSQLQIDAILWSIANGEEFEIKQLNAQGKVFKAMITPTIAERKAAIETYNKRFGSNEAIKTETKIEGNIETTFFYLPENGRKKQS